MSFGKSRLEKHNVCIDCYSVGITYTDCICQYGKFPTIELEFEVCECCGNLIKDGNPADSEFNTKQFEKLNK